MTSSLEWTLCPEQIVETSTRRAATSSTRDSGHSRARQTTERALRSWRLRWSQTPSQAASEYERVFERACGSVLPVSFTPPDESALDVRFVEASRVVRYENAVAVSFEFEFEEFR